MYFNLVEPTDFDALEGQIMMTSKQIIASTIAHNKKEAELNFRFLAKHGVIYFSKAAEVEEGTREDYLAFIGD
jgi:hypothetical protein